VHSYRLLGVTIDNNLKWCSHVDSVCAKASSRLHFLKILKRCSLSATDDIVVFYNSAVRPVLEYAYPAWHTSLTEEQSSQIELIQKRAFGIIFSSNCLDYENFCYIYNLDTLEARRTELCRSFFTSNVLNENSCLHYLFPPPRVDAPYSFRCQKKFEPPTTRTSRFSNSFIIYGAKNYQTWPLCFLFLFVFSFVCFSVQSCYVQFGVFFIILMCFMFIYSSFQAAIL